MGQGIEIESLFYLVSLYQKSAVRKTPAGAQDPATNHPAEGYAMTRLDRLLTARPAWPADGGLETSLIYHQGIDLPHFAAYSLLETAPGRAALEAYFAPFLALAARHGTGFVLDTATWRANMGWAAAMGRDAAAIAAANRAAVDFAAGLRAQHETARMPIVINGAVGPSGDGYRVDAVLTPEAAEALHKVQVAALAAAGADIVTATTMTHPGEAIGIARAAQKVGIAHVLSFTVETDGRLPNGQPLHAALAETEAATGGSAAFYMVNCAHPTHFARALDGPLRARIGGIRANASRLSHAELDVATTLDDGDPAEFGHFYGAFSRFLPNLRIVGGCCGSDHRHVDAACSHLHPLPNSA
jgi:S-methylmethionine-dependent homocysteine/selenocysteine methylase